ncbi:MAG: hypothetical protein COZ34_02735 [Candidatus Pacebacteria bacterium CG_4_10_14_3_um_filter_34_15]|nr:hypothetical protein [Candidatus Pacearchaeota archaeon]NCQ66068.1 hypothetical protein [Candidatus Paceibacterota bacterium]OIO45213.1 MAG: hypothetical protein AUJ41_00415 [Candidatus Pacebacteria bacterium CG1_02_43_31]PIQ81085.1 MAG: hypothetical protein COV78_02060 [Candidatus Pacebacteria bacterium CG11_big_fil_rev_8_21_14_0_20_34_55]PIX81565.1 MAG: hypothetical protein COZ34_02735 [Candidatus Pacebacteria bacterium CG_4_10_14_3_um_filter_34_15]PJC43952.1 MAG: hypothetical protein CO0
MKYQEKKYQVESFDKIIKILDKLGISVSSEKVTNHYYGQHEGNDVVKLVSYSNKNEIHILEESHGKFSSMESIPVENIEAGLKWLKNKGYQVVDLIKMSNFDYDYKGGQIRLYLIDDWLHSIILDYPEGQHEVIENELGLRPEDKISIPYNKQLELLGKLRSMKLE